jgi:hypothetical protein
MDSVAETWKPVPGFHNYEASSLGRVRSLTRTVRCVRHGHEGTRVRRGVVLKPTPNKGYLVVKLANDSRIVTYGVHQVVAMAFHGACPSGLVVDHINTVKTDNRPENLEYVTNSENVKRQYQTGLLTNKAGGVGRWKNRPAKPEA